jgi:hypothetical protein
MSSEDTINHNSKSTTKRKKKKRRDKLNPNKKEENNYKEGKHTEEQLQKNQLSEPIIYGTTRNQENIPSLLVVDDNKNIKKDQERIARDAKAITNYYMELHKNIINTYNLVYSQIIQNNSNLSWDVFFSNTEQFIEYQSEMKNIYAKLINDRDESLKLVDKIITENLDTFIKSIEFTQKFYKNIIQSYFDCIKK